MIRTRPLLLTSRLFRPSSPQYTMPLAHTLLRNSPCRYQTSQSGMPPFPDPLKHQTLTTVSDVLLGEVKESDKEFESLGETGQEADPTRKSYIDTMEIFNELRDLGFTEKQSDIILRLINDNLTDLLDKIDSKMLSINELENELYLFEAAQSELRVEIKTSRELDLRTLQNEKASLENSVNEEFDTLNKNHLMSKNDSQVVINDQFSDNTLLQKMLKKKIQELNNKISTDINSEIKSEIESLRWQTTRSGLMAVLVLVFAIMVGVNISKNKSKEETPQQVILRTIQPEDSIDEQATDHEVSLKQLLDQQIEKK